MKCAVIGTGSWGTALAQVLCDNQQDVILIGRESEEINDINLNHKNSKYFKDISINPNLKATADYAALKDVDVIVLSVPSIAIRSVCEQLQQYIFKPVILVNTAKGFDPQTQDRLSNVIRQCMPDELLKSVVSLIGPSHAEEVIIRMMTTISAVSLVEEDAMMIQKLFSNEYFRVYRGSDEVGSELGVAIKNTIALASGMLSGLGYGDNTRAALMTRGLKEMMRYGMAHGGKMETFMGLTGMGDLIVTCTSVHSRNFQAGYEIGKADSSKPFWEHNTKTVEGVRTTQVLYNTKKDISMPIVDEIYKVLYEDKKPSESGRNLMLRELKPE